MPLRYSIVKCCNFNKKPNVPLFKVYDYNFKAWNKIIPEVNRDYLRKITCVCTEHFSNDDFITNYAVPKCLSVDKEKILDRYIYNKQGWIRCSKKIWWYTIHAFNVPIDTSRYKIHYKCKKDTINTIYFYIFNLIILTIKRLY